ncbi:hypothetical protein Bbelb_296920 [Branchiostoma belcheri]|nr:hypothetical protein Bbelb_296920 [Branchiostoma belcheri]
MPRRDDFAAEGVFAVERRFRAPCWSKNAAPSILLEATSAAESSLRGILLASVTEKNNADTQQVCEGGYVFPRTRGQQHDHLLVRFTPQTTTPGIAAEDAVPVVRTVCTELESTVRSERSERILSAESLSAFLDGHYWFRLRVVLRVYGDIFLLRAFLPSLMITLGFA